MFFRRWRINALDFFAQKDARYAGGGYQPMEDAHLGELRAQGRTALRAWIARYRGAFEADGVSLDAISAIAQEPSSMVKEAG